MIGKHIKPGTRLAVKLSTRERDLVLERAFLDPELEAALRQAVPTGFHFCINLNLDDIDDLLGCVSAEANHCNDGKVQGVLDAFGVRLSALLEQYTDEPPVEPVEIRRPQARFTAKQGQYLAFIHYYTKVHRRPPAEADLQRYFRVSPAAVHTMILTLERQGLLKRTPGKARSIQVRILRLKYSICYRDVTVAERLAAQSATLLQSTGRRFMAVGTLGARDPG